MATNLEFSKDSLTPKASGPGGGLLNQYMVPGASGNAGYGMTNYDRGTGTNLNFGGGNGYGTGNLYEGGGGILNTISGNSLVDPKNSTWLQKITGGKDKFGNEVGGVGSLAFGAAKAGLGAYFGFKEMQMANKQLEENQRQFDLNFGAAKKSINNQLRDREAARHRNAAPGEYKTTVEYL